METGYRLAEVYEFAENFTPLAPTCGSVALATTSTKMLHSALGGFDMIFD